MRSNVRPFPIQRHRSDWWPRILSALAYLLLGYVFRFPNDGLINVVLILGILYWAFIHHKRLSTPYFLRYHLLQALLLNMFLLLGLQFFQAAVLFLVASCNLFGFNYGVHLLMAYWSLYFPLLALGVVMGAGLVLAVASLMGKSPRVPVISDAVLHWV